MYHMLINIIFLFIYYYLFIHSFVLFFSFKDKKIIFLFSYTKIVFVFVIIIISSVIIDVLYVCLWERLIWFLFIVDLICFKSALAIYYSIFLVINSKTQSLARIAKRLTKCSLYALCFVVVCLFLFIHCPALFSSIKLITSTQPFCGGS